ncbi:MAG: glycine zipper 2TM domain-containing protein [Rhodobiaceae bacterium]|nr:glycine zipper 2TM domain-containing protein [Rhodobiaceae bacterium]
MTIIRTTVILIAMATGLAACSDSRGYGGGPKAGIGTVAGAIAGGVIGNQIGSGGGRVAATAIGAVLGGLIGHEIGTALDERDRERALAAEYQALEYGRSGAKVGWTNPDSGHYGEVVPGPAYESSGNQCRTYTHTIFVDGRPQTASGTACRRPDGTWQTVS